MSVFQSRKEILLEQLADNAGIDPIWDRHKCGYIAAINDLLNIEIEEIRDND